MDRNTAVEDPRTSPRNGRLSADDWAQAALTLIAEQGVNAVAVEPLARRLGVTKDLGFGVIGLAYSDTNAEGSCSAGEAYCWGTSEGTRNFKDVGRGTAILSFSKSF